MTFKNKTLIATIFLVALLSLSVLASALDPAQIRSVSIEKSTSISSVDTEPTDKPTSTSDSSTRKRTITGRSISEEESYFKAQLEIQNRSIEPSILPKLITRKRIDTENIRHITRVARLAESKDRATASSHLLDMDRLFISRLSKFIDAHPDKEAQIKSQVKRYIGHKKALRRAHLNISDKKIGSFYKLGVKISPSNVATRPNSTLPDTRSAFIKSLFG